MEKLKLITLFFVITEHVCMKEGKRRLRIFYPISTEHSSYELRVIGTYAHRVDSYFFYLTMSEQSRLTVG